MRLTGLLLPLVFVALGTVSFATAQDLRPKQVEIEYVEPKNARLIPVYNEIRRAKALEKIQTLLAPLRLPRRLLVKTGDCDGVSNAWYENDAITVCYEFLDDIWKNVPAAPVGDMAPIDALVGPVIDVFLHEAGHAVFDYWQTPILGREEDAADQFSTFIMLKFEKEDARRLILGNAFQYQGDIRSPVTVKSLRSFADVHGTPSQRYYNVLCMAYGSDPLLFADFLASGKLPKDRAEGCEFEYAQVANAFQKLVAPYIDEGLAKELHNNWLPSADARPASRSDRRGLRRVR
jgi:hypothetical protein